jgi:plasmid stabilization system protein ParE
MAYRVGFSHSARSDINEIVRYISTDDRNQAFRFGMFLIRQAMSLGWFPERGRVLPKPGRGSYREIFVRAYRIVYRVDPRNQRVEIIRFWHAGRDTPQLPG